MTPVSCVLREYLEEQSVTCLRLAKSANDGTQAQREWLLTAEVLIQRAKEHEATCQKCKKKSKEISENK